MKNSKKITIIASAIACLVASVSSTFAYFTAKDHVSNVFRVGEVDIQLKEPNWPTTPTPENVTPRQQIAKDPYVTNTGKNPVYIFLKVGVPKANFNSIAANGTRQGVAIREIFLFKSASGIQSGGTNFYSSGYSTLNKAYNANSWTLLSDYTNTSGSDRNYYVFAYNTAVAKGASTSTLFDNVMLYNTQEGYLDNGVYSIDIDAYAIQSTDLGTTNLSSIYQIYLTQNS